MYCSWEARPRGTRPQKLCARDAHRGSAFAPGARVVIRIARLARVTLWGANLQILRPGEVYDVPPAVAGVLIAEGWAEETVTPTANSEIMSSQWRRPSSIPYSSS
jgi:hypothetical protein